MMRPYGSPSTLLLICGLRTLRDQAQLPCAESIGWPDGRIRGAQLGLLGSGAVLLIMQILSIVLVLVSLGPVNLLL
ncbi:hypothetical protein [Nesterenkonia sp. AY15]|uniref:hypothetical protein n=2 Tax=unclassified Nesterenkonia TaxID=2629769 RepID=UPI001F4D30AE|nr:hypothetical protein [Nesterenkonia sp. AY15]